MLTFYYHPTPNPMKVALFLAEAELPFTLAPIDTLKGEQHTPEFRKINPNGKLPAIDDDGKIVFDSNAILLYLAEKTGRFLGPDAERGTLLSWLMFIASGLGPYSGQSVHFRRMAPENIAYACNRYLREAERHYGVLNDRLEGRQFILGDDYTIVDIAAWGWMTAPASFWTRAPWKSSRTLTPGSKPWMRARRWPKPEPSARMSRLKRTAMTLPCARFSRKITN